MRLFLVCAAALAGCGDGTTVVFVTVRDRDSVRAATSLEVTADNEGATRSQTFPLDGDFPLTFTITPAGRTGVIDLKAVAVDGQGLAVASGAAQGNIRDGQRADLELQLDPTDFVVNSTVVGTQKLVFRTDYAGRQLAVHESGPFLVVWENDCPLSRCDILARLFEADTRPRVNQVTQTADEFVVNQAGEWTTVPSVAAGTDGFLVAWVYRDDTDMTYHIKATALDPQGAHRDIIDTAITVGGPNEGAPTVLARPGGGYVVVWERERVAPATGAEIIARRLNEVGALDGPEIVVAAETAFDLRVPHGAGLPGGGFVLVWTETDAGGTRRVRGRVFAATGAPLGTGDLMISDAASGQAAQPHAAATADGFVVGWQFYDATQRLEARGFDADGLAFGGSAVLSDPSDDFYSSPSLAVHRDGRVAAVWHDCEASGDGMGCGILLALLDQNLVPLDVPTIVNTTQPNNQDGPTVVPTGDGFLAAWTDASLEPPDVDGSGVRARRLYPAPTE